MLIIERGDSGGYVVSSGGNLHYGTGSTLIAALLDYYASRIEYAFMHPPRAISIILRMLKHE